MQLYLQEKIMIPKRLSIRYLACHKWRKETGNYLAIYEESEVMLLERPIRLKKIQSAAKGLQEMEVLRTTGQQGSN